MYGSQMFLRKPVAEVRREVSERSKGIMAKYNFVNGILSHHEATIHKRWYTKSRHSKSVILDTVWPNMAPKHRPDLQAILDGHFDVPPKDNCQGLRPENERESRAIFLCPYINKEDMLKPNSLLMLLSSRGRHHPANFALGDSNEVFVGTHTRILRPIDLFEDHVMFLNGAHENGEYGQLVALDGCLEFYSRTHDSRKFTPGLGLLVLEAQEKTLQFLVDCCQLILEEIPTHALTSNEYTIKPEPGLKSENVSLVLGSRSTMSMDSPYHLPAKIDLRRIEGVLAAAASSAEDHLWSLREDPRYFADYLFEVKEHHPELSKGLPGSQYSQSRATYPKVIWAQIMGEVLDSAFRMIEAFSELRKQAALVRRKHLAYISRKNSENDLPKEFFHTLSEFRYYITEVLKLLLLGMEGRLSVAPPLRKFFSHVPRRTLDRSSGLIEVRYRKDLKQTKVEKNFLWLFGLLCSDHVFVQWSGLPMIIDEIARLIGSESKAQGLLSVYVEEVLEQISILTQCLKEIGRFQQRRETSAEEIIVVQSAIKVSYDKWSKTRFDMQNIIVEKALFNIAHLANPSGGRFTYPVEKRRSKQNVEALRRAERNLDELWAGIMPLLEKRNMKAAERLQSMGRTIQRTPEWVEDPVENPTSPGLAIEASVSGLSVRSFQDRTGGIPISQTEHGYDAIVSPKRKKAKTRGVPNIPASRTVPASDTDNSASRVDSISQSSVFAVDARSLKVFRTLFYIPSIANTPGEISWTDFLHAIVSVGFSAEKLYGSVWQFQNLRDSDRSRIQFHEPHPTGKIPFFKARRFGRKLAMRYGWDGSSFVLKDKSTTRLS